RPSRRSSTPWPSDAFSPTASCGSRRRSPTSTPSWRWLPSPPTTCRRSPTRGTRRRSEEHTSELQSLRHLVCRLLLEKKNNKQKAARGVAGDEDRTHPGKRCGAGQADHVDRRQCAG